MVTILSTLETCFVMLLILKTFNNEISIPTGNAYHLPSCLCELLALGICVGDDS